MRNRPFWSGSQQIDTEGRTLLDKPVTAFNRNVIIGQFFEYLTSRLFDGELFDKLGDNDFYPDVILWHRYKKRDVLLEVKATQEGPLISKGQLDTYKALEENNFPFTRPVVYYAVYLHSARDIKYRCPTVRDLIIYLTSKIDACYLLPIDAILRLATCNNGIVYNYGQWRSGSESRKYIRWSKRLDKILRLGDRTALRDFLDLVTLRGCGKIDCFKDFNFSSQSVNDMCINRHRLRKFNLVTMSYKNGWKGNLCKTKS